MQLNDYQTTIGDHNDACPPINPDTDWYFALKLCGEAGEVAEHIGKANRVGEYRKPVPRELLVLELGDALWYLSMLARKHGITLEEVALANIDKVFTRYPLGGVR